VDQLQLDDLREGDDVAAPDEEGQVLQDDRDADGGDEGRQARRVAQGLVRGALDDEPTSMQTGIAMKQPIPTITSGGRPVPASATITEKATMQPIITTSPCAKLMSWMMP
jgi:hypothetical protein